MILDLRYSRGHCNKLCVGIKYPTRVGGAYNHTIHSFITMPSMYSASGTSLPMIWIQVEDDVAVK